MGDRGPSPTPTRRLELRGSWRAKTRPDEPRPKAKKPRAPSWLTKDAKSVFSSLVRRLHAEGMVTGLDENALARYADLFVQYRQASEFIAKFGAFHAVPGKGGAPATFRTLPHAYRVLALAGELIRLEREFGLTPAARARLVKETPEPAEPAFDYFQPMRTTG